MPLFTKKPVVIEARQVPRRSEPPHDTWGNYERNYTDELVALSEWCGGSENAGLISIPTLEGVMTASPGDWIIRGVKGEFYPCKPDIFEATYEPALNEDQVSS